MYKITSLITILLSSYLSIAHASGDASISLIANPAQPTAKAHPGLVGLMKVLIPQRDLETAIRASKKGDILVYDGTSSWYKIEGRSLHNGTRVYVLGEGSLVSVFPKMEDNDAAVR